MCTYIYVFIYLSIYEPSGGTKTRISFVKGTFWSSTTFPSVLRSDADGKFEQQVYMHLKYNPSWSTCSLFFCCDICFWLPKYCHMGQNSYTSSPNWAKTALKKGSAAKNFGDTAWHGLTRPEGALCFPWHALTRDDTGSHRHQFWWYMAKRMEN